MLCLSGFELYSRWVPLIILRGALFRACSAVSLFPRMTQQKENSLISFNTG